MAIYSTFRLNLLIFSLLGCELLRLTRPTGPPGPWWDFFDWQWPCQAWLWTQQWGGAERLSPLLTLLACPAHWGTGEGEVVGRDPCGAWRRSTDANVAWRGTIGNIFSRPVPLTAASHDLMQLKRSGWPFPDATWDHCLLTLGPASREERGQRLT